jgi:hypothetical protein
MFRCPTGSKRTRLFIGEPWKQGERKNRERKSPAIRGRGAAAQRFEFKENVMPRKDSVHAEHQIVNKQKILEKGTSHPIYKVWHAMRKRCNRVDSPSYKNYGGRGIRVCDEWNESFDAFVLWCAENGWRPRTSIERIDNDGHYEPSNCRFANAKEQGRNRRSNRLVTAFGVTMSVSEWADRYGIYHRTVIGRLNRGWSPERAVSIKARTKTPRQNLTSMLTARGQTKHIEQWAKDLGVGRSCIEYRISLGWSVEDAVSRPPRF